MKQQTQTVKIFKLGTLGVSDKATKLKGMFTHCQIDGSGGRNYLFQPNGLSPKNGLPVESFWVDESRIIGGEQVEVELPLQVIGTQVEDIASGFKGLAVALTYHLNGCVHFAVKSAGVVKKTGQSITAQDFDIRRLKGDAIVPMEEEELEKSHKKKPSPAQHPVLRRM